MINGIEILSQSVKKTEAVPLWVCTILLIPLVLFIISMIFSIIDGDTKIIAVTTFGTLLFFIVNCFSWSDHFNSRNSKYTEYKVIISDSVNFNEFNDKYEILDREGKIYTIRERQPDKKNY